MKTSRFLILSAMFTLAACGGGGPDMDEGAPVPARVAVWPLLDDEGHAMPSLPGALPDDTRLRMRHLRYATASQGHALEQVLGARVVRIDLDSDGSSGGVAVVPSLVQAVRAQKVAGSPGSVPVLVRSRDLRQAVEVAALLVDAGLEAVWVVRS